MQRHDEDDISVAWRLTRVVAVVAGVVAAVTVAVAIGAVPLPGFARSSHDAPASDQAALAAQRTAADQQWASAACANILDWKNEIQRDGTSLDLGFGPGARIHDAITATTRLMSSLDKLGFPPGAQSSHAQAELNQLRSAIESRLRDAEAAASSVAGGDIAAIATLVGDLENDKVFGTRITGELRHVVSVDLGLSLVETRACRQLVGIPV